MTLKKSLTPGRTPLKSWKDSQEESSPPAVTANVVLPLPKPANTCPDANATPVQTASTDLDEEPFEPFKSLPAFTPSKARCPTTPSVSASLVQRAQQLRQSVTKRLSSVDHGWLQRCQVFDEMDDCERPVAGNVEKNVEDPGELGGGCAPSPCAAAAAATTTTMAELTSACASPNKPSLEGDGAARNAPAHPRPPDDRPQMGGVTSPVGAACLWAVGHGSSLGPNDGGGGGEGAGERDGETRPGLGGAARSERVSAERASGTGAAKKPRARARKEQEEEEDKTEQAKEQSKEPRLKKAIQRKGRKRQREEDEGDKEGKGDAEQKPGDGGEENKGTAKKRRRTTKKGEKTNEASDSPKKAKGPRGRKQKTRGSGGDGSSDPEEQEEKKALKQKPTRLPQENLLGEVDEEDARAASSSSRVKNIMRPRWASFLLVLKTNQSQSRQLKCLVSLVAHAPVCCV